MSLELKVKDLKVMVKGQTVSGVLLLRDWQTLKTKTGGNYISGSMLGGEDIMFKCWENSAAFKQLTSQDYTGKPVVFIGKIDDYGGQISLIVESIELPKEEYPVENFLKEKYDVNKYFEALKTQAANHLTPKGYNILDNILFSNETLCKDFKIAFAAKKHHDNCKAGLLAHTYKVFSLMAYTLNTYKSIVNDDQDIKDLLYIGCIIHDIGKVWEMNLGSYTEQSIVTHRYLGAEYVSKYKDKIISEYSEMWYYNLISILLQHHDEWGEPCKTVYAKLVNLVDDLDAKLTSISEAMEEGVSTIQFDGKYLTT